MKCSELFNLTYFDRAGFPSPKDVSGTNAAS
jgi:hypothetical protein